jgi:uncharacterized protein
VALAEILASMRHKGSARVFWSLIAILAFFAIGGVSRAEKALQRLEIVTASGPHEFQVELADTPEVRAKGLMFRKSMPQDHGMLFDFHAEVPVMMWMRNTYIPLDMVFVSRQGVVTKVVSDAVPMSEEIISGGQAYAVIEFNAGTASRIGLKAGDQVRHPAFKR